MALISLSLAASDAVNPAGICCTSTTPASRLPGSIGITCCSDLGPPVEQASATSLFFPAFTLVYLLPSTFTAFSCGSDVNTGRVALAVVSVLLSTLLLNPVNVVLLLSVVLLTVLLIEVLLIDDLELVATLSISNILFLNSTLFVSR